METYRVQETKCDGTIDLYNGTDMLEENKDRMYSMTHPNGSTYETCINWNQYYTECRAGPENPFKGAISFDNIGYAWIAIFQDRFLLKWAIKLILAWWRHRCCAAFPVVPLFTWWCSSRGSALEVTSPGTTARELRLHQCIPIIGT